MHNEWLTTRLAYLRGLKAPSEQQRLLILIADKPELSKEDGPKLAALIRAEKAGDRAQKARADAARIVNAEKTSERKARDHELYQVAGLLSLAGLVDKQTGKPISDRGELLGALLGLAKVQVDDQRRAEWKRAGDSLIAASGKKI
uniref:conjugal transfer protein TraD n=1 Tax=Pseudomonas sp. TaxID=306 RepID=UPI0011628DD9|nr:conjugal transfer protein TraD [Pseudomonas sp.]QDK64821.1 mobilization protein MobC [Pseudomonas sp.]